MDLKFVVKGLATYENMPEYIKTYVDVFGNDFRGMLMIEMHLGCDFGIRLLVYTLAI